MITAIITCAGNGSRFGKNKLLANLEGEPVFIKTVSQFAKVAEIQEIIVAVRQEEKNHFKNLLKQAKLQAKLVIGGEQRHLSALNCLKKCKGNYVLIHDGARPLVTPDLIKKIIAQVKNHKAVIPAVATHTSIKMVYQKTNCRCEKSSQDPGKCLICEQYTANLFVDQCLPRKLTWLAQTPQAFKKDIILKAYLKGLKVGFVGMDDSEFVSLLGVETKIIPGEFNNLKITLPDDLIIAEKILELRENQQSKLAVETIKEHPCTGLDLARTATKLNLKLKI